jgi:hypothetical protein
LPRTLSLVEGEGKEKKHECVSVGIKQNVLTSNSQIPIPKLQINAKVLASSGACRNEYARRSYPERESPATPLPKKIILKAS